MVVPGAIALEAGERAGIARQIIAATRSPGGRARVAIAEELLNFRPYTPDVLGPRFVPLESTQQFAGSAIDLRSGVSAPGDGVVWRIQLASAESGEPLRAGIGGAWQSSPDGFRGEQSAYYTDAFRGWTEIGDDGVLTIPAHDPIPYEYPPGSGNMLQPHIHASWKNIPGHPDGTVQLRVPTGDVDDVTHTVVIPRGEGRIYTGPWDAHANAKVGTDGFVLPSEPPPLGS